MCFQSSSAVEWENSQRHSNWGERVERGFFFIFSYIPLMNQRNSRWGRSRTNVEGVCNDSKYPRNQTRFSSGDRQPSNLFIVCGAERMWETPFHSCLFLFSRWEGIRVRKKKKVRGVGKRMADFLLLFATSLGETEFGARVF